MYHGRATLFLVGMAVASIIGCGSKHDSGSGNDGSGNAGSGETGSGGAASASMGGFVANSLALEPTTTWQWQLSRSGSASSIDTSYNVKMYDIDLIDNSDAQVAALKAAGHIVTCYINAGAAENWRTDFSSIPSAVIGQAYQGWQGEFWLDTRAAATRTFIQGRLDLAKQKGCDGVEPDNLDGYNNPTGFPMTQSDGLAYAQWLVKEAHARGLSIGQKNVPDLTPNLVSQMDWALVEECAQQGYCDQMKPYVAAGKAVFAAEYGGDMTSACQVAKADGFQMIFFPKELTGARNACN